MKKGLAVLLVLAMLFVTASSVGFAAYDEKTADGSYSTSYRSVQIQDDLKEKLAKKGIDISEHLPAHIKEGTHLINEQPVTVEPIGVDGELNAIALYLKFPANPDDPSDIVPATDTYESVPVEYLQDMLFGTEYNPYDLEAFEQYYKEGVPTDSTLHNYYDEISYGKVNVTGKVVEVEMPHPFSYYAVGRQYGILVNEYGDYTMSMMLEDAVRAADEYVDFSNYAVDGVVPNTFLIHPGTGAEWNVDPAVIWSHSWSYREAYLYNQYAFTGDESYMYDNPEDVDPLMADGVEINNYSVEPEVGGDITAFMGVKQGPFAPQVGVYAHEFGHVLGVPDQYDYGYDSEGTGLYSLMAGGSWTRYPNNPAYSGNMPVHMDAWSKLYLELADVEVLEEGQQTYNLLPASDKDGIGTRFVKIIVPGSNGSEYFLIENRQQVGYDRGFCRISNDVHGLEIYHIDENVISRNFWRPNEQQNWFQNRMQNVKADYGEYYTEETHYGFALVQADNNWDLEKNKNAADARDLFKTGDEFTPISTPNSGSYYITDKGNGAVPNYTGIYVNNIVEESDGTITFTAGFEEK